MFLFLLSMSAFVTAGDLNPTDQVTESRADAMSEIKELKVLMKAQMQEWDEMKPALQRLIRSEQDLALIIAALDKATPLSSQPTEKQLLESNILKLPVKQDIKNPHVVAVKKKPATINKVKTTKVEKPASPVKRSKPVKDTAVVTENKLAMSVNAITQIGIHLASYKKTKNVELGWQALQRQFTAQFKGKIPFYYQAEVGGVMYTRLVVGSFKSQTVAKRACFALKNQGQYCQVLNYKVVARKNNEM